MCDGYRAKKPKMQTQNRGPSICGPISCIKPGKPLTPWQGETRTNEFSFAVFVELNIAPNNYEELVKRLHFNKSLTNLFISIIVK